MKVLPLENYSNRVIEQDCTLSEGKKNSAELTDRSDLLGRETKSARCHI